MWSALENIALRENLPSPLQPGESVHDILVAGQLDRGRHNLHHFGRRRSKPYLLKQFYSIDTNAFLRWQNEARFIDVPQTAGFAWPCEEWRGGLITPYPEGITLDSWLAGGDRPLKKRLTAAADLARQTARLHASGIAHRGLSPTCVRITAHGVSIADFGYASCCEWDDFWTDSTMNPGDPACVSPELLRGHPTAYGEDVYAFGCILHLLLSGKTAFGSFKRAIRTVAPEYVSPTLLPDDLKVSDSIRAMESACLAADHRLRPSMETVTSTLVSESGLERTETHTIPVPANDATVADRQKVMVFIKDPDRAVEHIDEALRLAKQTPALLLFVGLIPNNLPCGHAERFMGGLFRRLGHGLARFRSSGLPWSLRILENVDQPKAEEALKRQYRPDISL